MVNGVFGNLDRKATFKAFEQYLRDWEWWKLKAMRSIPTLGSPIMDGQPHGTTYDPDKQFANHSEDEYQWRTRISCCKRLMMVSEEDEILGDILLHRFIEGWSVVRTMDYINEHYNAYMSERTFNDKQKEALWKGALICPDDSVRVRKSAD